MVSSTTRWPVRIGRSLGSLGERRRGGAIIGGAPPQVRSLGQFELSRPRNAEDNTGTEVHLPGGFLDCGGGTLGLTSKLTSGGGLG